jgi:hypothetical protein
MLHTHELTRVLHALRMPAVAGKRRLEVAGGEAHCSCRLVRTLAVSSARCRELLDEASASLLVMHALRRLDRGAAQRDSGTPRHAAAELEEQPEGQPEVPPGALAAVPPHLRVNATAVVGAALIAGSGMLQGRTARDTFEQYRQLAGAGLLMYACLSCVCGGRRACACVQACCAASRSGGRPPARRRSGGACACGFAAESLRHTIAVAVWRGRGAATWRGGAAARLAHGSRPAARPRSDCHRCWSRRRNSCRRSPTSASPRRWRRPQPWRPRSPASCRCAASLLAPHAAGSSWRRAGWANWRVLW